MLFIKSQVNLFFRYNSGYFICLYLLKDIGNFIISKKSIRNTKKTWFHKACWIQRWRISLPSSPWTKIVSNSSSFSGNAAKLKGRLPFLRRFMDPPCAAVRLHWPVRLDRCDRRWRTRHNPRPSASVHCTGNNPQCSLYRSHLNPSQLQRYGIKIF